MAGTGSHQQSILQLLVSGRVTGAFRAAASSSLQPRDILTTLPADLTPRLLLALLRHGEERNPLVPRDGRWLRPLGPDKYLDDQQLEEAIKVRTGGR